MAFFQNLRNALDTKKISYKELTSSCIQAIQNTDKKVGAFLSVNYDQALETAEKYDSNSEKKTGARGIPICIKDLICTKDSPTTAASKILENYISPFDATVVTKIKENHMPVLGKVNLDEFGMGSSNEHSAYGITKNPWNLDRVPGGSSGGSAAAVAACMSPLSLGTDTGGSIRQPSSFCGLTGLKPTYGRVSRWGLLAYASSLDQIGPMGVDAESCAAVLDVIAGHDPKDATSALQQKQDFYHQTLLAQKEKTLPQVIGWIPEFLSGLDGSETWTTFFETKKYLETLGVKFVEFKLESVPYALAAYYIVSTSEASSNLSKYDGVHVGSKGVVPHDAQQLESLITQTRTKGFGEEVKTRILLGSYALSSGYYDAYYQQAAKVRRWIHNEFENVFKSCQMLLAPCTPTTAFKIGEKINNPLDMYKSDIFTIPVNLAGLPAVAFPTALSKEALPLGLQLIGPRWSESALLNAVSIFQNLRPDSVLCQKAWEQGLGI